MTQPRFVLLDPTNNREDGEWIRSRKPLWRCAGPCAAVLFEGQLEDHVCADVTFASLATLAVSRKPVPYHGWQRVRK